MDLNVLLAAILISLLGLPHGALDPVVAYQNKVWRKIPGLSLFLIVYAALTFAMIMFWWATPLLGFIVFIAFSAVHFGRDYCRYTNNRYEHWAYGTFVIGLPLVLNELSTAKIIDYLLFGPTPLAFLWILQVVTFVSAVYLSLSLSKRGLPATFELGALAIMAYVLDPLWYFVVFFCGLHSPRHLRLVYQTLNSELRFIGFIVMLFLTILTLLVAVGIAMRVEASVLDLDSLLLQILFIGLAGLTVPHMVLIEWIRERK